MSDIFEAEAVVIGAGVIGLAIAAALARQGLSVIVVERENQIGSITSARNSEVIHAGLYYPPASAKARHCVAGRKMLYDYLEHYKIGHHKIGKYIVAPHLDDEAALTAIQVRGHKNGAGDVRFVSQAELARAEPEVEAALALFSPETGIVDSHGLMLSLLGEVEAAGGALAVGQEVRAIQNRPDGYWVMIEAPEPVVLRSTRVVNAAGHGALPLARATEGLDRLSLPGQGYAKGTYLKLSGSGPFSHLIYPMPVPGALGIHATLDLMGGTRFGPDIQWTDEYDIDLKTCDVAAFYTAVRTYWPGLPDGALIPDYCGVRPKIYREGSAVDDFLIETADDHGLDGLVALYGVESPGLTSALSIGASVAERLC